MPFHDAEPPAKRPMYAPAIEALSTSPIDMRSLLVLLLLKRQRIASVYVPERIFGAPAASAVEEYPGASTPLRLLIRILTAYPSIAVLDGHSDQYRVTCHRVVRAADTHLDTVIGRERVEVRDRERRARETPRSAVDSGGLRVLSRKGVCLDALCIARREHRERPAPGDRVGRGT